MHEESWGSVTVQESRKYTVHVQLCEVNQSNQSITKLLSVLPRQPSSFDQELTSLIWASVASLCPSASAAMDLDSESSFTCSMAERQRQACTMAGSSQRIWEFGSAWDTTSKAKMHGATHVFSLHVIFIMVHSVIHIHVHTYCSIKHNLQVHLDATGGCTSRTAARRAFAFSRLCLSAVFKLHGAVFVVRLCKAGKASTCFSNTGKWGPLHNRHRHGVGSLMQTCVGSQYNEANSYQLSLIVRGYALSIWLTSPGLPLYNLITCLLKRTAFLFFHRGCCQWNSLRSFGFPRDSS